MLAVVALALAACSRGNPAPAPPHGSVHPPEKRSAASASASLPANSVQLLVAGTAPLSALRYAPTAAETKLDSAYSATWHYHTRFGPIESHDGSFTLGAEVELDRASIMMGIVPGNFTSSGRGPSNSSPCSGRISISTRGIVLGSSLDERCTLMDEALFRLPETPLRPALPLPEQAIGVGSLWRARAAADEPRGTYTLLDTDQDVWTVWGEFDLTHNPKPTAPTVHPAPSSAWLIAQITASEPMKAAILAWFQGPKDGTKEPFWPAPSSRVDFIRFSTLSAWPANKYGIPHDELGPALDRALAHGDATVRRAAIQASGLTKNWRLLGRLIELRREEPATVALVDRALALLTGREARGMRDWIDASLPYGCQQDAARAQAILSSGVTATGTAEQSAMLLALRADARRDLGDFKGANQDYRDALARAPRDADIMRAVAWWLATAPEATERDPDQALAITRAIDHDSIPGLSGQVQAAAYAALGDFKQAKHLQSTLVKELERLLVKEGYDLATYVSVESRRNVARARLDAYSRRKPWQQALTPGERHACWDPRLSYSLL